MVMRVYPNEWGWFVRLAGYEVPVIRCSYLPLAIFEVILHLRRLSRTAPACWNLRDACVSADYLQCLWDTGVAGLIDIMGRYIIIWRFPST